MPTPNHTPAAQIEKHILENACTSNWLRSAFELAIQRDPVDALQDAEVLVTALRARTLDTYSVGAPFNAQFTAVLLQQHAEALGQLAKGNFKAMNPRDNDRFKLDIDVLVMQLHQVARDLVAAGQRLSGEPASQSATGQLPSSRPGQ